MIVLVLNCGRSSVKFQVIDGGERRLARGLIERIGGPAIVTLAAEGRPVFRGIEPIADHAAAVRRVIDWIKESAPASSGAGFAAVGHRVVHGGARFVRPAPIDDAVIAAIEELEDLAPLHNGPSLARIRACRTVLGDAMPMVAVFDTAFHATRAPAVRARICAGMEWCGLVPDPARNEAAVDREARISADGARVQAFVIPTDEELLIARDTVECLGRTSAKR